METCSALLFPSQRPVTWIFDIFFDLRLNKRLSKQSRSWWFETLSCPLWRHCNDLCDYVGRVSVILSGVYWVHNAHASLTLFSKFDKGVASIISVNSWTETHPCYQKISSSKKFWVEDHFIWFQLHSTVFTSQSEDHVKIAMITISTSKFSEISITKEWCYLCLTSLSNCRTQP